MVVAIDCDKFPQLCQRETTPCQSELLYQKIDGIGETNVHFGPPHEWKCMADLNLPIALAAIQTIEDAISIDAGTLDQLRRLLIRPTPPTSEEFVEFFSLIDMDEAECSS